MYFKIEKDIVFYHAITSIKLNNRDIVIKANGETYVFSGKKTKRSIEEIEKLLKKFLRKLELNKKFNFNKLEEEKGEMKKEN